MPVDYSSISEENRRKYGTDIKRIGGMLLSERYDDRTHFIFELLQNAEDALAKQGAAWQGNRTVTFSLSSSELTVSHFGKPFDEDDVRGVCGIGESTKKLTDIGRFGIGFKSVYAFADSPEIHSGDEHFAIDDYVHPRQVSERLLELGETVIRIPFKKSEPNAKNAILNGLRNLSTRTLLFLRQIEKISWRDPDNGMLGLYRRGEHHPISSIARKVKLVGQDSKNGKVEREYIVFSREVFYEDVSAGHVEVAFSLHTDHNSGESRIQRAANTELVVFFPTILSTNLGFVMQGPYRTTPSRDNVPENDNWNRYLISETAHLLIEALTELRELKLLSISALECLPLERRSSIQADRFIPMFKKVEEALLTERLLPTHNGEYVAAQNAVIARGRGLRELINSAQLAALYSGKNRVWISSEITQDRARNLYNYLTNNLGVHRVPVVTPGVLTSMLNKDFLEAQPDEWIQRLYEFMNSRRNTRIQQGLLMHSPLVRLEDGSHVVAKSGEQSNAYLPTEHITNFPTVRASVCTTEESLEFLEFLGLREPNPVDDVIMHVLPRYKGRTVSITDEEYKSDINRILRAYRIDSSEQRSRLVDALKQSRFIKARDAGNGSTHFVRPEEAYQETDALKKLFADVPDVLFVDGQDGTLKQSSREIRNFLSAVGTQNTLSTMKVRLSLTETEKLELRRKFGDISRTRDVSEENFTIMGLRNLLALLQRLPPDKASERAKLLWDALCQMVHRNPNYFYNYFYGSYHWFYRHKRSERFPAHFVEKLNEIRWIPDKKGELQLPKDVIFEDTGWKADPNLQSEINFMPSAVKELAEESGIDHDLLVELKQRGITTLEQLKQILPKSSNVAERKSVADSGLPEDSSGTSDEERADEIPADNQDTPYTQHNKSLSKPEGSVVKESPGEYTPNSRAEVHKDDNKIDSAKIVPAARQTNSAQRRKEFAQRISVSPDERGYGPNNSGPVYEENMEVESQALDFIISQEPALQKTPPNNAGFDLIEHDDKNVPVKWVEVKSLSGSFGSVTLTRTQFEFAQKKQEAFWLYVVENTGTPNANIVRIENPAGKVQEFTFNNSWRNEDETLYRKA